MKRWHVRDEGLNRLVGTAALVVVASLWLCVAVGLFSGFADAFIVPFVPFDVTMFFTEVFFVFFYVGLPYVGLPLVVALGWYAAYRLWKRNFYRKPIANTRQIIGLLGSLLFVMLVAFCTFLVFLMVYFAVAR